jgi:helicase
MGIEDELANIELKMVYGLPYDYLPLLKIQGVGRARALKLGENGIWNPKEIIGNPDKVISVLGENVGKGVVVAAKKAEASIYAQQRFV